MTKANLHLLQKLNWYKNLEVDLEEILKEQPDFLEGQKNLKELQYAIELAEEEYNECN